MLRLMLTDQPAKSATNTRANLADFHGLPLNLGCFEHKNSQHVEYHGTTISYYYSWLISVYPSTKSPSLVVHLAIPPLHKSYSRQDSRTDLPLEIKSPKHKERCLRWESHVSWIVLIQSTPRTCTSGPYRHVIRRKSFSGAS